jgi:hypothetical protein
LYQITQSLWDDSNQPIAPAMAAVMFACVPSVVIVALAVVHAAPPSVGVEPPSAPLRVNKSSR